MKNYKKVFFTVKLIVMITFFIVLLNLNSMTNAASASINVSSSVEVNKTVTISVSGSGVQWNLKLLVDGAVVATNSELENFQNNKNISFSYQYTPTTTGTKTIQLQGTVTEFSDGSTVRSFSPATITVVEPAPVVVPEPEPEPTPQPKPEPEQKPEQKPAVTKSSDAKLKSLSVEEGTLSPEFNSSTTEYTLNVGEDVDKLDITARLNHAKAIYSVYGNEDLQPGENLVKVVVKAEDGTTKTYKINVIKAAEELILQTVVIRYTGENGEIIEIPLNPEFNPTVLEYTLEELPYTVSDLVVDAIANKEDAIVEIQGNTGIQPGENKIIINVKVLNEDETVKEEKTYNISFTKQAEPVVVPQSVVENKPSLIENVSNWFNGNEEKIILISLMSCSGMLLLISIYMIYDYKKQKELVRELKMLKGEPISKKEKKAKQQAKHAKQKEGAKGTIINQEEKVEKELAEQENKEEKDQENFEK